MHKEVTKSGKEQLSSHLKSLKEKLSGYGSDPLTLGYPINLTRGEKIDKNVDNDMRQVEILGKTKFYRVYPCALILRKSWIS